MEPPAAAPVLATVSEPQPATAKAKPPTPAKKQAVALDFAGIEVLPINAFPQGNALIGNEETAAEVKRSGVDAVIIGNAA